MCRSRSEGKKAPVDLLAGKTLADFACPSAKNAAEVAATFALADGVLTMNGRHPLVLTTKERWRVPSADPSTGLERDDFRAELER